MKSTDKAISLYYWSSDEQDGQYHIQIGYAREKNNRIKTYEKVVYGDLSLIRELEKKYSIKAKRI